MSLRVSHARGPAALADVGGPLDDLLVHVQAPTTSRRPWLQTWVDCYPDWSPWLVLVHDGADLVAAAPLATRRRAGLLRVVGLGDGPTDDLRLPAVHPAAARVLARGLADALPARRPWHLGVRQLPRPDLVVDALLDVLPNAVARPADGQPFVHVQEGGSQALLSKNTRKSLAKIRNRLARDGLEPVLTWHSRPEDIAALLPELAAVHRERDEGLGRASDLDDPRAARFYHRVIQHHADRGEVELLTLRLSGELAAYVCAVADGRTLRSWDNRLRPAWSQYSAGRLANTEALEHVAASARYDTLDWMRGEEAYKLQSATGVALMQDLTAGWPRAVAGAARGRERARALKQGSRTLTAAWEATAAARRGARALRSSPRR